MGERESLTSVAARTSDDLDEGRITIGDAYRRLAAAISASREDVSSLEIERLRAELEASNSANTSLFHINRIQAEALLREDKTVKRLQTALSETLPGAPDGDSQHCERALDLMARFGIIAILHRGPALDALDNLCSRVRDTMRLELLASARHITNNVHDYLELEIPASMLQIPLDMAMRGKWEDEYRSNNDMDSLRTEFRARLRKQPEAGMHGREQGETENALTELQSKYATLVAAACEAADMLSETREFIVEGDEPGTDGYTLTYQSRACEDALRTLLPSMNDGAVKEEVL